MITKPPLYKGEQIKELIPQREPIIMIDAFYGCTATDGYTGFSVYPENIFCHKGFFSTPGLIEHIAQSASAFIGYMAITQSKPVRIGYIGEIKNYHKFYQPCIGNELRTVIHILSEVMGITLISAETKVEDRLAASCQMKIALKK